MRRWQLSVAVLSLLVPLSVLAASVSGAKPVKPIRHAHHTHHTHHARKSVAGVHPQVGHESEVRQLQQDVATQESASRQASERLQQQDRTIAELQKQLQDIQAKPATDRH